MYPPMVPILNKYTAWSGQNKSKKQTEAAKETIEMISSESRLRPSQNASGDTLMEASILGRMRLPGPPTPWASSRGPRPCVRTRTPQIWLQLPAPAGFALGVGGLCHKNRSAGSRLMAQQDEKNIAASGFVRPSNRRRTLHQPQQASILEPNQPQALLRVSFCFNKQISTTRSRCMTARARYERIPAFFWPEDFKYNLSASSH